MRISGLASGIDTDEMVRSLMRVERLKVDRFEQSKQVALWRQEIYNNLNKDFANFILNTKKELGLTTTTSTGFMTSSSYSNLSWVKKATSSNETIATVSGTSKAVNGNFQIEVDNLAKGATFTSAKIADGTTFGTSLKFELNGEEITVENADGITMDDIVKKINSAKTLDGNGKEVSLGVSAFFDKNNGRLFLQTTAIGENAKIELEGIDGGGSAFQSVLEGTDTNTSQYSEGKDATVIYNGVTLNYSSNRFNLNNINVEIKSEGVTNVIVDTNVDGMMEKIEKFVNDYNELIDKTSNLLGQKKYNSYRPLTAEEKKAMDREDINLWEEKAKSGLIRNDDIVTRTLQTMRGHLYDKVVGGTSSFDQITSIGITTEKYAKGSAGGKLQIDKEKLQQAILQDAEGVLELLFKEADYSSGVLQGKSSYTDEKELTSDQMKAKRDQSGIFTRLYDDLIYGMQDIITKSGSGDNADLYRGVKNNILLSFVTKHSSISALDKDIFDMDKKIDNLNALLVRKENSYYARFTAMEKAISKMNSQSSWLAQQFM